MTRTTILIVLMALTGHALAQDVQGVELCTREAKMDRRTGCLQSNIEYLQKLVAGNAADAQRKLNAATAEINALKAALANLQATVEKLQATASKPPAKPETK